jgi:outer membrane receptor protein involved in Fe transport
VVADDQVRPGSADRRECLINGAVFFQDFTDKQALTSALGNDGRLVSKIENAGAAEVWGAELSVAWSSLNEIFGGLVTVSGAYTWLDTEYTDFTVVSGSSTNAAGAGNCTPTLVGEELLCSLDYTGNQLEDAPPGAFNGFVNYTIPMSDGVDFYAESNIMWQDKRFAGVTNNLWMDAFWNFDVRIGFQTDRWEALLYVENVLDNDTVRMSGGGPGLGCCFVLGSGLDLATPPVPDAAVMVDLPLFSTAFLPPPRLLGFRLAMRFGG